MRSERVLNEHSQKTTSPSRESFGDYLSRFVTFISNSNGSRIVFRMLSQNACLFAFVTAFARPFVFRASEFDEYFGDDYL